VGLWSAAITQLWDASTGRAQGAGLRPRFWPSSRDGVGQCVAPTANAFNLVRTGGASEMARGCIRLMQK
jgi:hypothetical protein